MMFPKKWLKIFMQVGGQEDIKELVSDLSRRFVGWYLRGSVMDFGCGLGRLGIALAQQPGVEVVVCVDQSVYHGLKTAKFTSGMPIVSSFYPIVSGPDLLMSLYQDKKIPKCYDLVNSIIVLQHMITPLQGVYLEQFCDILRPGGIARLQIPWKTPRDPGCSKNMREHYRELGGMQMHYIDESSIIEIMSRRGCDVSVIDIGEKFVGKDHASLMIYAQKRFDVTNPCVEPKALL